MSFVDVRDRSRDSPARAFLVDRARGDLLGAALAGAAIELALLDALVLTSALRAGLDATWGHVHLLKRSA